MRCLPSQDWLNVGGGQFEFGGRRLGVLNLSPRSIDQAMLIAEWGPTTFLLSGASRPDEAPLAKLRQRRVVIESRLVRALHGDGTNLSTVEFDDGGTLLLDARYVGPRIRLNSDIAEQLGCQVEAAPIGPIVTTDSQKITSIKGSTRPVTSRVLGTISRGPAPTA
jgi:hypothetical protein